MAKLFSLEQANALIPTLERQLRRLEQLRLNRREVREDLADLELKARSNGRDHAEEIRGLRERLESLQAEENTATEEITALGCEIKSLEEGLIDFPARREGRVVYLCWKLGEDRIRFWHELTTGFAGRRPLDEDLHG